MKCNLCNQPIKNYDSTFHHLKIDDYNSVDICPECIDKLFKWQGSINKNLFPTRAMKARYKDKS
ncbi:MAG: hypothetical protein ACP5OA_02030 [Candidatus Woesearchaeota archaeon]